MASYGSKKTSGGGTSTPQTAGVPGLTPNGGGGTSATYSGQPSSTGEKGYMGDAKTPNIMEPPGKSDKMPPRSK